MRPTECPRRRRPGSGVLIAARAAEMAATGPEPAGSSTRKVTARMVGRRGPATTMGTESGRVPIRWSRSVLPETSSEALSTPPSRCAVPPARTMADHGWRSDVTVIPTACQCEGALGSARASPGHLDSADWTVVFR